MSTVDVFALPVHPAAEVFPMLAPDELAELAEDIREHGLAHPIVVKAGVLIDGRNRREACRMAGVEPSTVELNGQDPIAYVLSTNIARRHLTKGQRAMAVARLYPEPAKGGRGKTDAANTAARHGGFSNDRLNAARAVLRWAPELTDSVQAGAQTLDVAYAVALERKTTSEAPQQRLEALRASDPDLADKVVEGDLALPDAEAAMRARRQREREKRQGLYEGLKNVERWKFLFSGENAEYLAQTCRDHPDELSATTVRALLDDLTALFDNLRGELT